MASSGAMQQKKQTSAQTGLQRLDADYQVSDALIAELAQLDPLTVLTQKPITQQ
jgi:hypothetical protein